MLFRSRESATLTLIPISQSQHFTLVVIDNMQRQIRGYDSLYGNPEYDNAISNNIRTIRQLLADEAVALGLTDYADNWTVIHDAARREGLPRQINGVDCGRYVILMALCLTQSPPIPLATITPLAVSNNNNNISDYMLHKKQQKTHPTQTTSRKHRA